MECLTEISNNTDLIAAILILIVDIIYFVGKWGHMVWVAKIAFCGLCMLGFVSYPFIWIAFKKKIHDIWKCTQHSLSMLCIWNIFLLLIQIEGALSIASFFVAGCCILTGYTQIYTTIFMIYMPIGYLNIGVTVIKNIVSFCLSVYTAHRLKRVGDNVYTQIYELYVYDRHSTDVCLGLLARSIMDPATWNKMESMIKTYPEFAHTDVKDHLQKNIRIQYGISIVDLILNLTGDICMGLCRVYPYSKLQACLNLGMAILYDIRLFIKKALQCKQRCKIVVSD